MTKLIGYNFFFQYGGKKIAGVTDDQLQINPKTKESLTKEIISEFPAILLVKKMTEMKMNSELNIFM